jgi:hypothetical protein
MKNVLLGFLFSGQAYESNDNAYYCRDTKKPNPDNGAIGGIKRSREEDGCDEQNETDQEESNSLHRCASQSRLTRIR